MTVNIIPFTKCNIYNFQALWKAKKMIISHILEKQVWMNKLNQIYLRRTNI